MEETFIFSHGGGGSGCSVECSQLSSSILKQSLCSTSAIQEHVCQGVGGNKGGNRRVLLEQSSVLLSEQVPNQVVVIT